MKIFYHIIKYKFYYFLGLIFFIANFKSLPDDEIITILPNYIILLQNNSAYIVLGLMLLSIIFSFNGKTSQIYKSSKGTFFFFIFQIIVILSGNGDFNETVLRFLLSIIIFFYFLHVIPKLEQSKAILSIFLGVFLFTVINFLCYFLFPDTSWKGRLFGVGSHPNFIGVAAAISTVFSLYFFFSSNKYKIFWGITVCIGILVCIFSGSRNSIGMIIISFLYFILNKFKNPSTKILIISCGILVLLFLINMNISLSNIDYTARGNNREETWGEMLKKILEFPLLGEGRQGSTSNSYLFSIVAGGIIGAVFLYLSLFEVMKKFFLEKKQKYQDNIILYKNIVVVMAFSALFEGFLLDQVSIPVYLYWFLLAV